MTGEDHKNIFIAGVSAASKDPAAYCLDDRVERIWLPNWLKCLLNRIDITTQQYECFDPQEILIALTTSISGECWSNRTSLDSQAAN